VQNQRKYSAVRTIQIHLFEMGFMPSYNVWTSHGEQGVQMEEDEIEDENIPDWAQYGGFEGNTTCEVEGGKMTLQMILVRCCNISRRTAKVKRRLRN
jgi:hypothetical protein